MVSFKKIKAAIQRAERSTEIERTALMKDFYAVAKAELRLTQTKFSSWERPW